MRRLILTVTCPDGVGIVAAITGFIADHGGWVLEAAQHGDLDTGQFFLRIEIVADSLPFDIQGFGERFASIAETLKLEWRLHDTQIPKKVVILASKEDHCLADLLYRWKSGNLPCEIPLIISNHPDLAPQAASAGIEFVHVPMTAANRNTAFQTITELFDRVGGDVMVLARFMQIVPADVCDRYAGRIINIHHSFLPSFIGAKPYHQAYERGVKLIGATCHYATADLDAGPIIEQDIVRITHAEGPERLVALGRDIERIVLARGLQWHLEDRVLVNGNKTVVFS